MMQPFDPLDEAIDEALGENLRAQELEEMIRALEIRRDTFAREHRTAANDDSRKSWQARIQEIDKQIEVLKREQAISGFVERSVRASASRPRPLMDWNDRDEIA